MSQKTYVWYEALQASNRNVHVYGGGSAYRLYACEGKDDPFRSRLGWPANNSGPWFVAKRTTSGEPSTDGAYRRGVCYAQHSGGSYEAFSNEGTAHWYIAFQNPTGRRRDSIRVGHTYDRIGEILPGRRYANLVQTIAMYQEPENSYGQYATSYPSDCPVQSFSQAARMVRDEDFELGQRCIEWAKRNVGNIPTLRMENGYPYTSRTERQSISGRYSFRMFDDTPDAALYKQHLDTAQTYLELGILPGPWAMGLETAYIEACNNMPQAATNMAANILEAASLLTSIFTGDIVGEIPKTARQAWLAYRYSYTTTKMDIREVRSTFSRITDLTKSNSVRAYGSYARGGNSYHVGFDVDTAQLIPRDVATTLQKFGLELNLLNSWDMIPYSFVVDWFLPVSAVIEYFQSMDACRIEPRDLWWSIVTTKGGCESYSRLPGRKLSTLPYLQLKQAGTKTIFMRIGDAVALFS